MGKNYSHETSGEAYTTLVEDPIRLNKLEKQVLETIKDKGVVCEHQITEITGLERCSSTARINSLFQSKFIEVHKTDKSPKTKRKVKFYSLTEKGRQWFFPQQVKLWVSSAINHHQPTI